MVIFKRVTELQEFLSKKRVQGLAIAFVPTMGALHYGHLSLIEKARSNGSFTVCSIFLNPTQFNNPDDFSKYPVSTDADVSLLLKAQCDVLFLPHVNEIYPNGAASIATFDFGFLDTILEGAQRPGHFKGVGQVVARLLDIVNPDSLYLGQKDYQQCMVIKRLAALLGLERLQIVICPTLREPDGLAMSSRNRRLCDPQRALAALLYQCLVSVQSKKGVAPFAVVQKECFELMLAKGIEPEYLELANTETLELYTEYAVGTQQVALIAARIGNIRLIDNLLLN